MGKSFVYTKAPRPQFFASRHSEHKDAFSPKCIAALAQKGQFHTETGQGEIFVVPQNSRTTLRCEAGQCIRAMGFHQCRDLNQSSANPRTEMKTQGCQKILLDFLSTPHKREGRISLYIILVVVGEGLADVTGKAGSLQKAVRSLQCCTGVVLYRVRSPLVGEVHCSGATEHWLHMRYTGVSCLREETKGLREQERRGEEEMQAADGQREKGDGKRARGKELRRGTRKHGGEGRRKRQDMLPAMRPRV
ncbi:hypothetical protein Anapl_04616 [Anas platyrhynchos]|uniref:Uncharacterized protein n=1 Tax=Anas platyrhynchos TaxID=8839 RepID=R0K6L8_ANAPL|nr:hypothetical protein Anapl_04616 [Anas platyrhynchos]